MGARLAAEDVRKATLPQNPDAYKLELPSTFAPPAGAKVEIDAANPLWAQARAWAHKAGLSQEQFAEGIALVMGDRVGTEANVNAARNAEIAKLGATGTARMDALNRFFTAYLGDAEGKQVMSRVWTASDVTTLEKLVTKIGGGGTFTSSGREPPAAPGRLSNEAYAKLSPAGKLDYNRQWDQSKMPDWRDPRMQ